MCMASTSDIVLGSDVVDTAWEAKNKGKKKGPNESPVDLAVASMYSGTRLSSALEPQIEPPKQEMIPFSETKEVKQAMDLAGKKEENIMKKRKGFGSTLLTNPLGIQSAATIQKKTLLGQ